MFRHRSKLVHATAALAFLAVSAALWASLGASATHTYAAACLTPTTNTVCNTSGAFSGQITGKDHAVNYVLSFIVNSDGTTQKDWHVTITSTQFATTSGPLRTLPTTASSITGVTNTCQGTCAVAINNKQYIYPPAIPVPAGAVGSPQPAAVPFYGTKKGSGNTATGVGTFDVSATISVVIPGNAYSGTYVSPITIAFVTGP